MAVVVNDDARELGSDTHRETGKSHSDDDDVVVGEDSLISSWITS